MSESKEPGPDLSNKPPSHSEGSSATVVPELQTETLVRNSEPDPKETVSSVPRAPVKRVWHYFFEFLMLFLAVFSGFVAENWRENLQERQREKEFIHSIVEDLKSDTLQSIRILERLRRISTGIDSVLFALASPEVARNSNEAYRLWNNILGMEVFVSNDRTIEQLKSSGELRIIRNRHVSDGIMRYEQTVNKYAVQSNLMYGSLREMTSYSELFDFIKLDQSHGKPVPLTEQGTKLLNQAYSNLQLWNRGLIGLIRWLEAVNEEGAALITLIRKEYELTETSVPQATP